MFSGQFRLALPDCRLFVKVTAREVSLQDLDAPLSLETAQ